MKVRFSVVQNPSITILKIAFRYKITIERFRHNIVYADYLLGLYQKLKHVLSIFIKGILLRLKIAMVILFISLIYTASFFINFKFSIHTK